LSNRKSTTSVRAWSSPITAPKIAAIRIAAGKIESSA
jgi:hypothetical protein